MKSINFFNKYLSKKISFLVIIGILCLTNAFSIFWIFTENQKTSYCEECPKVEKEAFLNSKIKVDIKGYVKKPGVYELDEQSIVDDLIKLAGGLKTNGTTDNINLSKKLQDEDMIVILSKTELKKRNLQLVNTLNSNSKKISTDENNSSVDQTLNSIEANKKISLNKATKEELMTLNGIGEAKALEIISYRQKTPFQNITEIKNVSGIGDSIYEKIKNNITL